jgi:hypothetical protein
MEQDDGDTSPMWPYERTAYVRCGGKDSLAAMRVYGCRARWVQGAEMKYPRNPPDCMARLDADVDIKTQSTLTLWFVGFLGIIPLLLTGLGQVADECFSELQRRKATQGQPVGSPEKEQK